MRHVPLAIGLLFAAAPVAAAIGDIPMVAIGLPFTPDTPTPVAPDHALYRDITIEPIEGLPATIKSSKLNFIAAAKRASVDAALRESFLRMNLLAPPGAGASGSRSAGSPAGRRSGSLPATPRR